MKAWLFALAAMLPILAGAARADEPVLLVDDPAMLAALDGKISLKAFDPLLYRGPLVVGQFDGPCDSLKGVDRALDTADRVPREAFCMYTIFQQRLCLVTDPGTGLGDPKPKVKVLCLDVFVLEHAGLDHCGLPDHRSRGDNVTSQVEDPVEVTFAL